MKRIIPDGEIQMEEATAITLEARLREAVHKASASRTQQNVAAVEQILDLKAAEFRASVSNKIRRIKAATAA
jgi:hypothetical protein